MLDYARTQLVDVISKTDFEEAKEIRQDRSLAEYGDSRRVSLTLTTFAPLPTLPSGS